ncbi:MAG TPA: hypothetical protein ENN32_08250 [Chloroflexi bacterium]|nr:hypothetical protein [Chloroflexota bacterium]
MMANLLSQCKQFLAGWAVAYSTDAAAQVVGHDGDHHLLFQFFFARRFHGISPDFYLPNRTFPEYRIADLGMLPPPSLV